ncbi:glycoside hydrolase family 43 protein [Cellvibrio polysaccharolyticus]|uniref:Glycoside hydrolase n=1 Tax=Cellvibrio polysaccharolyticus TaxID=2082724 RepID=A0A928UZZ3_9GAMM|nr:glycoside hydrolase family 43 protein [Cellvibrio polysaccharolyticus]MBE8716183.1 glycoside hydrolase [Cellvibrio polysaccharolyticus]
MLASYSRFLSRFSLAGLLMTSLAASAGNPLFKDVLTADPAAMVHDGTVYLYTGHDEAKDNTTFYEMHKWLVFSSTDMVTWKEHGPKLHVKDFAWAKGDAWAAHVVEKGGKFYWYVTVRHATINGFSIGVAVADSPLGPFKDALGKALITNDMTTKTEIDWDDLDPAAFVDDDGQAYLFWGNTRPYYAKLKDNMIELDGPIIDIEGLPNFTEAIYVHKHGDWYYLTYASGFPEKISYAMSKSVTGPWQPKGILNELAGNSNTNHQSVIEFKGRSFFIYHNGSHIPDGGSFRRSVNIDELFYNPDGTIQRVIMTTEGITEPVR